MPTTVTSKGQVTIPKPVRDLLGLHPGSRVDFRRTPEGRVELVAAEPRPAASVFAGLRGHARQGQTRPGRDQSAPALSTDEIMALTRGGG